MNVKESNTGQIAVKIATNGENKNTRGLKCDWHEFCKFVGIWSITAIILFFALMIITFIESPNNIINNTIKKVDTLNMMFSLVLSALLEQIWSKNSRGGLYSFTLGMEGLLTIIGGMLFVAYSIVEILNPKHDLLRSSFTLNIIYIIISTIVVLMGFFSRAISKNV